MGHQLRLGLQVGSGPCGLVWFQGARIRAPGDKLAEVVVPAGAVRFRTSGKGWQSVDVHTLDRLFHEPPVARTMLVAAGPVVSGAGVMVSEQCDHNRLKALLCRMFRAKPTALPRVWEHVQSLLPHFLPLSRPAPMSVSEWLETVPGRRRKALTAASELYRIHGWRESYALFSSFIKVEKLPAFSKDDAGLIPLETMVDRLINAPHDVTHVIAGPVIKPYMDWLKKCWDVDGPLFYASREPAALKTWLDRAVRKGHPTVVWSDYSMFDLTHSEHTWSLVESLYDSVDPDFRRVLRAWRSPSGSCGRNIRYRGPVMNASGRDDTAFANGLLNGLAMCIALAATRYLVEVWQVTPGMLAEVFIWAQTAVCGDDSLIILPEMGETEAFEFTNRLKQNLRNLGFVAKVFSSNRLEDAVFLGSRPLPVNGEWYWTPTLGRCLYKLGYICNLPGGYGDTRSRMRGVMEMHHKVNAHVPVLIEIANSYLRDCIGSKSLPPPYKEEERSISSGPGYYAEDTLQALARAYTVDRRLCRRDLSPVDVSLSVESIRNLLSHVISTVSSRPCVLDHWVLRHMVWVDEL